MIGELLHLQIVSNRFQHVHHGGLDAAGDLERRSTAVFENAQEGAANPILPDDILLRHIPVTNQGDVTARLESRHWIITDATGRKQEVRGEGVVGEQPVLAPGERFEYTSGVPLPTASGFMTGRYQMVSDSGERFEIDVPTFSLDSPDSKRVLN